MRFLFWESAPPHNYSESGPDLVVAQTTQPFRSCHSVELQRSQTVDAAVVVFECIPTLVLVVLQREEHLYSLAVQNQPQIRYPQQFFQEGL